MQSFVLQAILVLLLITFNVQSFDINDGSVTEYLPLPADEKCPYKDTVDLSLRKPFVNGSYAYQNALIPPDMLATYNYRLKFQNSVHATDLHIRGCVCSQRRYCVKLCCKNNHFFNETSLQCQKLPEDFQMPTEIEISMDNGTQDMVKIVQHFIPQVGQPCEMLESLSLKTDKWQLNEVNELYGHMNRQSNFKLTSKGGLTPQRLTFVSLFRFWWNFVYI